MIKTKYETNEYGCLISFNHIFVFNGLNMINIFYYGSQLIDIRNIEQYI